MCKFVPREAVQAWQRELELLHMSEQLLEKYTKAFIEAYQFNSTKYITSTIDTLREYTIASMAQILRYTAEPQYRSGFDSLWSKYKSKYPRLRDDLERTQFI